MNSIIEKSTPDIIFKVYIIWNTYNACLVSETFQIPNKSNDRGEKTFKLRLISMYRVFYNSIIFYLSVSLSALLYLGSMCKAFPRKLMKSERVSRPILMLLQTHRKILYIYGIAKHYNVHNTNIFHNLLLGRHGSIVEFVRLNTDILWDAAVCTNTLELQETLFRVSFCSFFTQPVSAFLPFLSFFRSTPFTLFIFAICLHFFPHIQTQTISITEFHSAKVWMPTPQVYISFLGLGLSLFLSLSRSLSFYKLHFPYITDIFAQFYRKKRRKIVFSLCFYRGNAIDFEGETHANTDTPGKYVYICHMILQSHCTERISNDFSQFHRTNLICLIEERIKCEKIFHLPFQCLPFLLHWK